MAASNESGGLRPSHRIWRLLPPRGRPRLLSEATAVLAPRPDTRPPPPSGGLAVAGELSRASGLGEVARLMLAGLERLGVPRLALDLGTAVTAAQHPVVPPPGMPLLLHVNAPFLPLALLRMPRGMLRGRRVIGYWAWELPVASPDWRVGGRFVHEVWALSRFTAGALEPLLPGRVRVVLPPLAIAPPRPSALDRAAFGLPDDAIVVLTSFSLASSLERKNPLQAIAAFKAAFGTRADRILLLKVGNPGDFPQDFAALRAAVGDSPNIRLETRMLPVGDSHALTACADIVLSLHRSEGFGLVPAEAMLLGKPVIATNWSGNTDFMDEENSALVGYSLVPARDPRGVFEAPGAVWADPDMGEAVGRLRALADDAAARAALGGRARTTVTERLGIGSLRTALAAAGVAVP
jgi:glycosyltransferase involved in cell wall biosynthesis